MKAKDIARQGVLNLLRHRGRTLLTVLGVIVGCCSVVIMISIGIGMRISSEATLSKMGDLTTITVNEGDTSGGARLDAAAAARIKTISGVTHVIPRIESYGDASIYAGSKKRYLTEGVCVIAESLKDAREMGYELTEGDWDRLKKGEILVGEYLAYSFRDTKRPEGHNRVDRYAYYNWETETYSPDLPEPYVDILNTPLTLVLGNPFDENAKTVSTELKVGGVLKENWNTGAETSEGILMDLDTWMNLKEQYAKVSKEEKKQESGYTTILVKVNDISNVEAVEKEIRKTGLRTSSMESIRKPMEQEVQQKQMLLGGVGAVSLFVAALGIANTMIMAISERIREIGVMKALGCFLKDVRKMFLLEAGCIGLIGGTVGIGISYLVSHIMNSAGTGALFGNDYDYLLDSASMNISVIPWWLAAFAILFSVFVGVAAGLYPAEKAVRIPALEAIRHE